jgi:ABC-type oligopeptide transport system ATPase subunit
MAFQKATKRQAKLRLALIGPSGSGKTYTALTIATDLVPDGRIALIDTERGSASKYADLFSFDVQELESFHPQRYIQAIQEAQQEGYDVLIIDSLSHAWMGKDGALELVDKAAKRNPNGNSFAAWRDVTPLHNALVDAMLGARLHIIVTLRSKQEWVVDRDEKGKTSIRKVGLQPVQRDGLEYEFDVVGDMDQDNTLVVTKTRCSALAGAVIPKPGKELADVLAGWLDGEPPNEDQKEPPPLQGKPVIPQPSNGNGKRAAVKTGGWAEAIRALVERCPCYAKDDDTPDGYLLTTRALDLGYPQITDDNLTEVIAALEQAAA